MGVTDIQCFLRVPTAGQNGRLLCRNGQLLALPSENTDITDIADIMDIMDIADIMDVTDVMDLP